ncbi:MAG: hypothetical protein U9N53_08175 [Bacteroidota bacterium]|nr:hypothetical protein [Bacteroidota bacterium]
MKKTYRSYGTSLSLIHEKGTHLPTRQAGVPSNNILSRWDNHL